MPPLGSLDAFSHVKQEKQFMNVKQEPYLTERGEVRGRVACYYCQTSSQPEWVENTGWMMDELVDSLRGRELPPEQENNGALLPPTGGEVA